MRNILLVAGTLSNKERNNKTLNKIKKSAAPATKRNHARLNGDILLLSILKLHGQDRPGDACSRPLHLLFANINSGRS